MLLRAQLVGAWIAGANNGTLLTTKHDPNAATPPKVSFRSVVSQEVSGTLKAFVAGGDYTINQYQDKNFLSGAGFFEVVPTTASGLNLQSLGILSSSMAPPTDADRLVFVSGSNQGWHVHAEHHSAIARMKSDGRLTLLGSL